MATIEEELQKWIANETHIVVETDLEKVPDVSTLSRLTEGENGKIWEYMLTHVRSKSAAEKVKRILKLKRDQTDLEKLFPKPANDFSKLRQQIKYAEDKKNFLENSVSNIQEEMVSTEQALRDLRHEIDKIHQKTAILHLITSHYQEKTALLNSLNSRLSFHLTDGACKQNGDFFSSNSASSAKRSYSANSDKINPRIKHLLEKTEYLVAKKFRNDPGIESFIFSLQMSVPEVFKGVLMYDLLFVLKEKSIASRMNMIKRLSFYQSTRANSPKGTLKRDSEKLLRELKLDHINLSFSVKKVKNYNCRLKSEKGSLLMSKTNPFVEEAEYQTKCELLEKIAENEGLAESINFLEEMLISEKTKVSNLKNINASELISNEDISMTQKKFYNDFDTVCLLKNSVLTVFDFIVKRDIEIHQYANEELYSTLLPALQEFAHEVEAELKFENKILWKVLRKNDVIKPLLQRNQTLEQSVPNDFLTLVDVAPFQNLAGVCRNAKLWKNFVFSNASDDWECDEERQSCEQVAENASMHYEIMMNMLQEMEDALGGCERHLEKGLNRRSSIETALLDWWEQGAQFIPDIEYDGKTLKMWIDVMNAAV